MPHIDVDSPGGVGVGRQLNFVRSSLSAARTSNIVGNVSISLGISFVFLGLHFPGLDIRVSSHGRRVATCYTEFTHAICTVSQMQV